MNDSDVEKSLLKNDEVVEYFHIKTGKRLTGHPIDAAEAVATGLYSTDNDKINRVAGAVSEPKPGTAAYDAMVARNKKDGKKAGGGKKQADKPADKAQESTETSQDDTQDAQSDSGDKILLMNNKREVLEDMVISAELATKTEAHNLNKAQLIELIEKAGGV